MDEQCSGCHIYRMYSKNKGSVHLRCSVQLEYPDIPCPCKTCIVKMMCQEPICDTIRDRVSFRALSSRTKPHNKYLITKGAYKRAEDG